MSVAPAPPASVLSALTQALIEAAVALGYERVALCDAAQLEASLLSDPDARVPLASHLQLWRVLSRRPIGLELGARLGIAGLGVVGYALTHDQSVLDALRFLERHRALIHPDAVPHISFREIDGEPSVHFEQHVPLPFAQLVEPVDAQAAAVVAVVRALVGMQVAPLRVRLQRARPDDDRRHAQFHRAPIVWNASAIEVDFSAAALARPLPRSDPRLFGYLARRAEALSALLPDEGSFATRVRRELGVQLVHGEPSLAGVGKRLGVSARTLHRRLADEQTRFAVLLEEARRERAFLLLTDGQLSASQVASLLGYGEPSAFFRAFRRWTGQTPQAWRKSKVSV